MITLNSLKTMADFVDASEKITNKSKEKLDTFIRILQGSLGEYGMYPEAFVYTYNEYMSNFRSRFVEIDYNNDTILVIFKYVLIHTVKYIRIFNHPISLKADGNNEQDVLKYLIENKIVKQMLLICDENEQDFVDQNFFNLVEKRWEYVNRSYWKSGHKLIRILANPNFTSRPLVKSDLEQVINTLRLWKETKEDVDPRDMEKPIIKMFQYLGDTIGGLGLFYKGTMIGYDIWSTCLDNTHITHLRNVLLVRTPRDRLPNNFEDDFFKSQKSIGDLMHFKMVEHLFNNGHKVYYFGGAGNDTGKILPVNKMLHHTNEIRYRIVDFERK